MLSPAHSFQRLARAIAAAARPWRVFALLLVVAVSYLALTPAPPKDVDFGWDKLNHIVAFTALAFSACLSYPASRRTRLLLLCGLLAYGGSIELLQTLVPNRSAEWGDLLADAVGIVFGAVVAALVLRAASAPLTQTR
jgi:VanZ family protein